MSVFGQLASLMLEPKKDAGFEDTFASRFGAAPLDPFEAAALRQRQFTNRQQAPGSPRAERVMGGLADLSKSLGEPVTRITDYSRSRVGTEEPITEEDVFRQDLASRNIGKGVAQAGAYGLPIRNPLGKVPSQAELRGGQLLAETPKAPPVVVQGIKAYHGSPHDFDKFDLSKIGTGEGAQAYGHGLYFAEKEGTARSYRDALSRDKDRKIKDSDLTLPSWVANRMASRNPVAIEDMRKTFQGRLDEMRRQVADPNTVQPWNIEGNIPNIERILKGIDEFAAGKELAPAGRMYEVNLNADPKQFLDWDRPLKDQPIAETIRSLVPSDLRKTFDYNVEKGAVSGANVYHNYVPNQSFVVRKSASEPYQPTGVKTMEDALQLAGGNPDLVRIINNPSRDIGSQRLAEAGIPGIRYLDQGSRPIGTLTTRQRNLDMAQQELAMAQQHGDPAYIARQQDKLKAAEAAMDPKGTSNYVVFDPGIIDILRKYGLAGAGATGFGTLAAQDNYKQ